MMQYGHIGYTGKAMKIDIYKSAKSGSKYLSVPSGTEIESLALPSDIDSDLLALSPFKTELELDASKPLIALDQADVESQISKNGYAIHGAEITINVYSGTT
ncbi:hypothetical protein [Salinisphaera sp. Q1T1-3]|uniref:hypothetical protein n=1 Tax=Salinisphaera sp. Q1T1-3 TaxID=2321229 RepID=UPI0011C3B980|nr:hypothetical protein [Salinisphaera sp. Q1T1-3]